MHKNTEELFDKYNCLYIGMPMSYDNKNINRNKTIVQTISRKSALTKIPSKSLVYNFSAIDKLNHNATVTAMEIFLGTNNSIFQHPNTDNNLEIPYL